ncbi:MAG: WD40/YVTN/BNR-like repeat-containing protein, partial [Bacteroidia bacterium]
MKKILLFTLLLAASAMPAQKKNPSKLPDAPEPKPTSAAERMAGLEKRKQAEARSLVSNIGFRNVGPTIMSGRVVDLDVNPNDPTHFYVAYASGGLFFTDNNGITFRPVFENEEAITIGDIAVDWSDPTNAKIWIGTGENNSSRSSYSGTGLYYSANNGKTWEKRGLEESHHVGKILIHPSNPNTVWVAVIGHLYSPSADRGVYKTTDGGKSWKKTLFINENTGVIDLFLSPDNANILYACAWHRERRAWNFVESGMGSGIHLSSNGGDSWNLLSVAASGFPQGEGVGRIGLSIFPSNTNIMYAIVDNQSARENKAGSKEDKELKAADFKIMTRDAFLKLDQDLLETYLRENEFPEEHTAQTVMQLVQDNKLQPISLADYVYDANADLFSKPIVGAEVYRSEDAGKSWKKTNEKDIKNMYYTYGYYFGKIWVSPSNANEIFIAGVSLLKSSDGGKTFQSVDGANQHGDHHALWMNPKRAGHLINGNDGGVNISWDNGKAWFKANTPAVGQFYAVAVDQAKPYNVYGGLQDNGVWTGPS